MSVAMAGVLTHTSYGECKVGMIYELVAPELYRLYASKQYIVVAHSLYSYAVA
jgi:hypothetical protein